MDHGAELRRSMILGHETERMSRLSGVASSGPGNLPVRRRIVSKRQITIISPDDKSNVPNNVSKVEPLPNLVTSSDSVVSSSLPVVDSSSVTNSENTISPISATSVSESKSLDSPSCQPIPTRRERIVIRRPTTSTKETIVPPLVQPVEQKSWRLSPDVMTSIVTGSIISFMVVFMYVMVPHTIITDIEHYSLFNIALYGRIFSILLFTVPLRLFIRQFGAFSNWPIKACIGDASFFICCICIGCMIVLMINDPFVNSACNS